MLPVRITRLHLALLTTVAVLGGSLGPQVRSERTVAQSRLEPNRNSSELTPLTVSRRDHANERALWLVDPLGLSLGGGAITVDEALMTWPEFDGLTVSHEWTESGLTVVFARVSSSVGWTYRTTIHIARDSTGELVAKGVVDYSYDAWAPGGPPPSGRLSDLTGRVMINAGEWKEGATVCLKVCLHGFRDDSPEWVQGQVTVR